MLISCPLNFSEWRHSARNLLAQSVPPEAVTWETGAQGSLFGETQAQELGHRDTGTGRKSPRAKVPKDFLSLVESASYYRDDTKWGLFYRMLWRITHGERDLLQCSVDADVCRLRGMQKAIARDYHKMKAFVRFKQVKDAQEQDLYIAWFEPSHPIIGLTAPFFVKRFTQMCWSISTPDGCAHWNGKTLVFSEGVPRPEIDSDAQESLWLTYYKNIFNPARVKLQAMQAEMPKKYWRNLPEAIEIKQLYSAAQSRVEKMTETALVDPNGLRNKSKMLSALQDDLRKRR